MTQRGQRNRQRGMAAVEFALILPIFMALLFGIVEFGSAFYKQQIITSAAREAARAGVIATDPRPSSTLIASKARDFLDSAGLDAAKSTVSVIGAGGNSGDKLRIQIEYPTSFALLAKLMAHTGGGGGNVAALGDRAMLHSSVVVELE